MLRRAVSIVVLTCSIFLLSDCARFKINDLESSTVLSLSLTATPNEPINRLPVAVKEGALYGLPDRPAIFEKRILLGLPEKNLILEFSEGGGRPEQVFLPEKTQLPAAYKDAKLKVIHLPAGQIGQTMPASNATIIQLFHKGSDHKVDENEPEYRMPAILFPESMQQPKSELIALRSSADRPIRLAADKDGSTAFTQIWQIVAGKKDYLYVLHSSPTGQLLLNVYQELALITVLSLPDNFAALALQDTNLPKDISVDIENVMPFTGRAEALATVVIRRKNNFEPLQRVLFFIDRSSTVKEIYRYDDKAALPVWTTDEGGFLLSQDEDGESMLLKVYSSNAQYEHNNRVRYQGLRESYQDTFFNGENRLFSVTIIRGVYEIIEWK